jgi:hypothetical protein
VKCGQAAGIRTQGGWSWARECRAKGRMREYRYEGQARYFAEMRMDLRMRLEKAE